MKIILYIGHHKVGSTALQTYLMQNWLRLAKAGILYPSVETRGFAVTLKRALDGQDAEPPGANVREPHSALAYRMIADVSQRKIPPQFKALPTTGQMIRALRQQAQLLAPDTLVLCSEAFVNFGQVDPGLVDRLQGIFPKANWTIYCALRRPDEYMISWHGQRLKVGEKLQALQNGGAREYPGGIHFDYRMAVQPWAERMPQARLILRDYSDILTAGGSEVDFAQQTGLALPEGMVPAPRTNLSLPRAAFEIVRRANHALGPQKAYALNRWLLTAEHGLQPARNSEVEMYGAELRKDLATQFASIHGYLNQLAGRDAFFFDIDEMEVPRPITEREAAAALMAQLDPQALPDETLQLFTADLKQAF